MKLWELVSATRQEPELLGRLGDRAEWQPMLEHVGNWNTLVDSQRCDVLDAQVPEAACRHVLSASARACYLRTDEDGAVRLRSRRLGDDDREVSALEVLDRCDGGILEEAEEYGSAVSTAWPRSTPAT